MPRKLLLPTREETERLRDHWESARPLGASTSGCERTTPVAEANIEQPKPTINDIKANPSVLSDELTAGPGCYVDLVLQFDLGQKWHPYLPIVYEKNPAGVAYANLV